MQKESIINYSKELSGPLYRIFWKTRYEAAPIPCSDFSDSSLERAVAAPGVLRNKNGIMKRKILKGQKYRKKRMRLAVGVLKYKGEG
jgi:hypothetical protein